MSEKPTPDDCFRDLRSALAGGCSGEVAEPGKSLELLGNGAIGSHLSEIEIGERERLRPADQLPGKDRIAA